MGMTDKMSKRVVHINNLIALKDFCNNNGAFTLASNIEQSLDYAISSLKTDLKYDLMYEGEEIYTKADMVAMLTEIWSKITEKSYYDTTIIGDYEDEVRINLVELDDVNEIIQQKINALKEDQEGEE